MSVGRVPVCSEPVPGIVEGQERRRAAERGGNGVLEEAVGLLVSGDAGVGVDVDHAGQHQQSRGVDLARVGVRRQPRSTADDPAAR